MPEMDVSNKRSNVFLALIAFELFFLQPVLGSHPVLISHLAIPQGDCSIQWYQNLYTVYANKTGDMTITMGESSVNPLDWNRSLTIFVLFHREMKQLSFLSM